MLLLENKAGNLIWFPSNLLQLEMSFYWLKASPKCCCSKVYLHCYLPCVFAVLPFCYIQIVSSCWARQDLRLAWIFHFGSPKAFMHLQKRCCKIAKHRSLHCEISRIEIGQMFNFCSPDAQFLFPVPLLHTAAEDIKSKKASKKRHTHPNYKYWMALLFYW